MSTSRDARAFPARLFGALLWFICGPSLAADSDRWVSLGLIGRVVQAVQVDPADASTLFALGGTIFKTTDSGSSWTELPSPAGTEAFAAVLGPLVIRAGSPLTLYLGMRIYGANLIPFGPPILRDSALLRSRDGGASWYRVSLPAPTGLAVDRHSARSVFAAFNSLDASPFGPSVAPRIRHGLYESRDDGETWTQIFDADVTAAALSPNASSTIYAVTSRDGLWKTEDSGANWVSANAGLVDPSATYTLVTNLAIDPGDPNILYVTTTSALSTTLATASLFRSSDAGRSWTKVSLPSALIGSLAVLPDSHGTLYAGTPQGVFRTLDGGRSWVDASEGLTNRIIWAVTPDPSSRTLYAATASGVFRLDRHPPHSPVRSLPFR